MLNIRLVSIFSILNPNVFSVQQKQMNLSRCSGHFGDLLYIFYLKYCNINWPELKSKIYVSQKGHIHVFSCCYFKKESQKSTNVTQ